MEHYLHAPWDLVLVELVVCCRGQWCSILGSRGRRDLHRKDPAQHHKPRGHSNLLQLPLSNIHPRVLNKETALEMFWLLSSYGTIDLSLCILKYTLNSSTPRVQTFSSSICRAMQSFVMTSTISFSDELLSSSCWSTVTTTLQASHSRSAGPRTRASDKPSRRDVKGRFFNRRGALAAGGQLSAKTVKVAIKNNFSIMLFTHLAHIRAPPVHVMHMHTHAYSCRSHDIRKWWHCTLQKYMEIWMNKRI